MAIPYLCVTDSNAAVAFYQDAFGAFEQMRVVGDDGRVGHLEFTIGEARFMMADEFPEIGVVSPTALGNTPVAIYLEVVDVDHVHRQAVDHGAVSLRDPEDQTHGNRTAGHRWMLSQPIEDFDLATYAAREEQGGEWTVTGATAPVEPGYLTYASGDIDRSIRFFSELFGWAVERTDLGGHVANTRFPMGFSTEAEAPVTVYFRVDDIDRFLPRIEELGGRVLARQAYASGGNAECEDDQGFRFDLHQPAPGY
jgi:PhnB protein